MMEVHLGIKEITIKHEGTHTKRNCLIIIIFCNYFILGLVCGTIVMNNKAIYIAKTQLY